MKKSYETNIISSIKPIGWGKRHTFSILGFTGFAISYAIRFNLSIAIVAMVNSTAISQTNKNFTDQIQILNENYCPKEKIALNNSRSINETFEINIIQSNSGLKEEIDQDLGFGVFNWNEEIQGFILGSFFWGYIITQLPGGFICHHFGGKWCFGLGILIPGLVGLIIPLAAQFSFKWVMLLRVIQGLGGGFTTPAAHALLAKWIPPQERKFSSLVYAGMPFGSALSMLISGYINHYIGWPFVFYTTGLVSSIWFLFWTFLISDSPSTHHSICKEELNYIESSIGNKNDTKVAIPWKKVWASLPFWSIIIGHTAETWAFYTLSIEVPSYLKTALKLDMKQNSWISAFPSLVMFVFSLAISNLGAYFIFKKWMSVTILRKVANSVALWGAAFMMVGIAFSGCNHLLTIIMLTMSYALLGGMYTGVVCNHIDIAPNFAAILMGITNVASSVPGFLVPLSSGYILKGNPSLEQWSKVFLLGAGVTFLGNLFFVIFASGEEQKWNKSKKEDISIAGEK